MKRVLFSLFTMLLLFVVGAQADYTIGNRVQGATALQDGDLIVIEAASSTGNYGYYIKPTSSGDSYAWQQEFDQASVWKAVYAGTKTYSNTYMTISDTTKSVFYFKNVQTGKYMAGTNTEPILVDSDGNAVTIAVWGKNTPWAWQDYSDQTDNPRGWDDNSVALQLLAGDKDYWLANDVGNRETGKLPNDGGLHNFMWNLYYAVENTPEPVVPDTLTSLSQIDNNHIYTITTSRGGLTVTSTGGAIVSSKKNSGTADTPDASTEEVASQWALLTIDGVSYYMYNILAQGFLITSGSFSTLPQDAMTIQLANNPNGAYCFKITNGSNTLNNNNIGTFALDGLSTENDGNRLLIQKAGDFDPSFLSQTGTLIWNIVDDNKNVVATDTVKGYAGREYSSSYASNSAITLATPKATMTAETQVITSTFTVNDGVLPFKLSTSFDNATWYTVKIRDTKSLQYNGSTVSDITSAPAQVSGKDLFAFVGTPFGFKIYNYAAGANAPFGPAVNTGSSLTTDTEANAGTFVYELSSENNTYQLLRYANNEIAYLNDVNSTLGVWLSTNNRHDAGSNFAFTEVELPVVSIPDGYVDSLVNGYYYIVAGWDGMSLETRTVDGGEYLYKHGKFTAPTQTTDLSVAQIFKIHNTGNNTYTIQNMATGNYVGAYNTEGTEGTTLAFAASNTAYANYIYPWEQSPNTTTDTGDDPYASKVGPSFVIFDSATSENEWSGRYTGQGWNVHSILDDRVAHAFSFYKVDSLVTEYLSNKDYYGVLLTYTNILNETPTSLQDGDYQGSFKGPWVDGTERTAVAGVETVQNLKDSLSAAIDAYKANPSDETLDAMKFWGDTVSLKWAPLTDGIYYIIPRFGDDQTVSAVSLTIDTSDNTAWRKPLVKTNPNFMFEVKITKSHTDSILGAIPDSMTIKNVGTGLYLGKISGSNWGYQETPVQIGYTTFTRAQFYSGNDSKHAHCFGLNIDDQFMTFAQNASGSAITVGTTSTYAWRRAWMFRPADKYYMKGNAELDSILGAAQLSMSTITPANHHDNNIRRSFLLGNEKLAVEGVATSSDAVKALQEAYNRLFAEYESGKSIYELTDEISDLNAAKAEVDKKSNPLVNGLYYLIAEFGDDTDYVPGGFALTYNGVTGSQNAVSKAAFNASSVNQIFKVTLVNDDKVILQNVASGKYIGSVSEDVWNFTTEPVELNITSGNGDPFWWVWPDSQTVAARSCAFVLTNDNNQAIDASTGANIHSAAYSLPSTKVKAWTCSWAFRPVGDSIVIDALHSAIDSLAEAYKTIVSSDEAGYYKKENVDAFKALYIQAVEQQASDTLTAEQKTALAQSLYDAYYTSLSERNPITNGHYFIKSTSKRLGSTDYAMYVDEDGSVKWEAMDTLNLQKYIFRVTDQYSSFWYSKAFHEQFTIQSVATGKYIGYGITTTTGNGNANAIDDPWKICVTFVNAVPQVTIQPMYETSATISGSLNIKSSDTDGGTVIFSNGTYIDLTTSNTDITWAFVHADDYAVIDTVVNKHADYWKIASEPSDPVSGKTYVLKNAYNNKYLSTNGGVVQEVDIISNSEIWEIEADDAVSDPGFSYSAIDSKTKEEVLFRLAGKYYEPGYYLKSRAQTVDSLAYWQYEDYSSKTWNDTTAYDGYDWFGYKGLNADFGAKSTAQLFSILDATEYVNPIRTMSLPKDSVALWADPQARSCVAEGKEVVEGSYVITAAKQVMKKFYKLGVQGTNAALEPYNEDVAWLFYEATAVEDPDSALQIALDKYGQKEMIGGVAPGYYSLDAVEQYNEIVDNAITALVGTDATAKRAATQALIASDTLTYEINPITDGYYYIVSAGNGSGYSGGPYNNEGKFALYNNDGRVQFAAYDKNDTKYVYRITGSGNTLMVKNIQDNSYIASYPDFFDYGCDVLTSESATTAQVFTWEKEGKFAVNAADKLYVWATAANHNGTTKDRDSLLTVWGTPAEAGTYGMNLWYLIPCSNDIVNKVLASYTVGDINNDGEINVGDLSKLISLVLDDYTTADDTFRAADINGDGKLNVGDYSQLVEMILSASNFAQSKGYGADRKPSYPMTTAELQAELLTIAAGQQKTVAVSLKNYGQDFNALQFDVLLPEGLTLVADQTITTSRTRGFSVAASDSRVVMFNAMNAAIRGTEGDILYLTLKADDNLAEGLYELEFSNIILADMSSNPVKAPAFISTVVVDDLTGIGGIAATNGLNVETTANGLVLTSDHNQTVRIYSAAGALVKTVSLKSGQSKAITLVPGIYVVNNKKVNVK